MIVEETSIAKSDPRIQFRCSSVEERDFFQNEINKSGMKPQQYFKAAVEAFKMQTLPEESEQKKALAEVDILTNRLNQINRSQLLIAFEMQEQAKKERERFAREKEEFAEYKNSLELKLNEEFEQKVLELEHSYIQREHEQQQKFSDKIAECENENLLLREQHEEMQAKYNKIYQEFIGFKKQLDDKMKLLNKHEEQEFELKRKVFEFEDKLKKHDIDSLRIQKLEIENAVLQERIEALKNEDKLKQQMIELQLKMSEKNNIVKVL